MAWILLRSEEDGEVLFEGLVERDMKVDYLRFIPSLAYRELRNVTLSETSKNIVLGAKQEFAVYFCEQEPPDRGFLFRDDSKVLRYTESMLSKDVVSILVNHSSCYLIQDFVRASGPCPQRLRNLVS